MSLCFDRLCAGGASVSSVHHEVPEFVGEIEIVPVPDAVVPAIKHNDREAIDYRRVCVDIGVRFWVSYDSDTASF